jgi:hypothetical protein
MPCVMSTVYTKNPLSNALIQRRRKKITVRSLQTNVRYSILFVVLLASLGYAAAPAVAVVPDGMSSVVIQKRRIVLVRTGKIARDFPERKRATVSYPVIKGPVNSAVLRKVRSMLEIKNIFGISLAEYRSDAWLSEFDYKVNYNRDFILDITFTQDGVGAYPDGSSKHFAINLKNGSLIRAKDVFNSSALDTLTRLVDEKLQAEIQQTIKDNPDDREAAASSLKDLKFKRSNLNDFSVSDKGLTFLYDAGFPHVIKALQPVGEYFFSYAELKSYIKREGLLGTFIR